ncbi:SAM-dependent methyltransferase [Nocardiopsis mwathae]|uniref:SAM-dependent methyltransferase n=1 Tax=Nocardiopsis mwathae TaxID=1472723 RepID=A0A7W9YGD3_9ACTN|nr:class I SAM-dependent methyltransferase [Nocardiopsis mwathae]MBB6171622.1 SAM-dependent methyltransferase [Nocardiopsis mwathae]
MSTPEEDRPDLLARVDELAAGAWVLAALAAALHAEEGEIGEEHGAVLGAAGLAGRTAGGWRLHPAHRAALDALPGHISWMLGQAADAAARRPGGAEEDEAELIADGEASGRAVDALLDRLASLEPDLADRLRRPGLRFLDVGTGTGAVAAAVVARSPRARAVGLDIDPRLLRLAEGRLAARGVRERVELRRQDVADLAEADAYDLVWLPLTVLTPVAARRALPRVRAALRPGGWVLATSAPRGRGLGTGGELGEAVTRWRLARAGVTPWGPDELAGHLAAVGLAEVREIRMPPPATAVVAARRPR